MCTNVSRALLVLAFTVVSAFSQTMVDAQVPVKVNVAANVKIEPPAGIGGEGADGSVAANTAKPFNIKLVEKPGPMTCTIASNQSFAVGTQFSATASCNGTAMNTVTWEPANRTPTANGLIVVKATRASNATGDCAGMTVECGTIDVGNVGSTAIRPQGLHSNQDAIISLYSIKGNKVQNNANLPAGIYLIKSNFFTTKIAHRGGVLKVNVPLLSNSASMSSQALAKPGDYGEWSIVVSAEGYSTQRRSFSPDAGENPEESFTLKKFEAPTKQSFTETVNGQSFDMIYVPGGTFTIGCEKDSGCPSDAKPVSGVQVSNYFIGKTEVSTGLWNAVMGTTCSGFMCQTSSSFTNMTWYDAMEFACRLSELTGKNYRMTTEAEWEYAAKNHLSSLDKVGSGEEWAYNTWSGTHMGGTDPLGPGSGTHNQKTRRDAQGTADNITGRLIRSIEGMGPALRLALSADVEMPPGYVSPCNLHAPEMGAEPVNSYRDPRWITGGDAKWKAAGDIAIGSFDLRAWEDGTATILGRDQYYREVTLNGQWFTSNNFTLVFVPSSGDIKRFAYIFLDETHGSLISDQGFMNGYIGRIERVAASSVTKPTISDLKSGEALAKAQPDFNTYYKMVDMTNPPTTEQDSRLIDTKDQGWFQDNTSSGGVHHYRKDVDKEEFRFTVNQGGGRVMLANGNWFTINNTFLRVTHPGTGYKVDYLYAYVPASGSGQTSQGETFYHNSFMGYERGDFRMFSKKTNGGSWPCGSICSDEIPTGQGVSMYNTMANGQSTFEPAPCPAGGCK